MNIKTVLITGARSFVALDLARTLADAGVRIICADSMLASISRYSKKVSQFYHIASPVFAFDQFILDIETIIDKEKIDTIIPTCEEIFYLAKAKERLSAPIFCEPFETLDSLHNKWSFYTLLSKLGLDTPETHLWDGKSRPDGKWVIKPIYSRFAANIHIVEKSWPTPSAPSILQKFIQGKSLCSYSVCHEGKISAHGVYRGLHTMGIGASICFEAIDSPEVDKFVKRLVKELHFTGQIAFDFIQSDKLYCIECNPRATSGIHLFERRRALADAFINPATSARPQTGALFHEHLFMLWYGIKQGEIFSKPFWSHFFAGKNPLLAKGDATIIFKLPLILFEVFKLTLSKRQGFNQVMTHDIEYNGEAP